MKITVLIASLLVLFKLNAQDKYYTKEGHIRFFSSTSVEDFEANNYKTTAVFDEGTGNIEVSVLMKSFEFKKALMEEHFNENYVESNTYPKAKFKGSIKEFRPGSYTKESNITVKGIMEIHGVSREVEIPGTIHKTEDGYVIKSEFMVAPEDYNIIIPKMARNSIASQIEVSINSLLALYTN